MTHPSQPQTPSPSSPAAPRITLHLPDGQQQLLLKPRSEAVVLSEILRQAHHPLNTRCGRRGLCEGCAVELLSGRVERLGGEAIAANGSPRTVKACEVQVVADVAIRIPARSSLRYAPQIVTDYRVNVPCGHDPLFQEVRIPHRDSHLPLAEAVRSAVSRHLDGAPVTLTAQAAQDAQRLAGQRQNGELVACVENAGEGWQVCSIDNKPTAPSAPPLGVAIDIGTTTVVALLVDLTNGKVLGQAAMFNGQMHLGDDVLTRINLCVPDKAMVRQLQVAVADKTIRELVNSALTAAGMKAEQVRCFSIAGNTTMLHLLAGIDPTPLGTAPFTPVFLEHKVQDALGIFSADAPVCHEQAKVHLLPSAAAYVGADLTAGVLASGMLYDEGPSLLVDVGTNGEIILKYKDQLYGCATAAGPAFEGAGLSCGMRAGAGTISHVRMQADPFEVRTEMIGDAKTIPVGICGSAYIDFLAEGKRAGLLGVTGRFEEGIGGSHLIALNHKQDKAFRLAYGPGKQPIAVSQRDIASLLQAKAATAAGILVLLEQVGLKPSDVKTVYLAGGFGTHMSAANAIGCGLLPGFVPEQIQPVGNTSLAGAYLALMDASLLSEIRKIGEQVKVIELNLDPNFESCYIDQLMLPD